MRVDIDALMECLAHFSGLLSAGNALKSRSLEHCCENKL